MFSDRPATTRSYERIEQIAQQARVLGRLIGHSRFNIVEFITFSLKFGLKVPLGLHFYDKIDYAVPAFVECENRSGITLNVEKGLWWKAEAGYPEARYILAHETGHILMHTHDKLAYSNVTSPFVASLQPEDRTEPQANLFADLFLVPANMLEGFSQADHIAEYFDVPYDCAKRRLEMNIDNKRRF